jgi:nuclear transport factor 2 (NTF2) superfamily protein
MVRVNGRLPWVKWGNYYWEREPRWDKEVSLGVAVRYAALKDAMVPPGEELIKLLEYVGPFDDGKSCPILYGNDYWTDSGQIASLINRKASIGNPPIRTNTTPIAFVIYCRPLDHKYLNTGWKVETSKW